VSGASAPFGWGAVVRLGLVQAMIGAVVVLTTSTLNRVMVVELALPALLPGLLVMLHHAVQLTRPRMGYGSDRRQRRTPWIVGGMAVLALGGFGAAAATAWMSTRPQAGIALAALAFTLVGLGVSAAGTSLLALLAKRVDASRRASAASLVWVMMIVGLAVTAGVAGRFLDPYTPARLVVVSGTVSLIAIVVTLAALWRLEGAGHPIGTAAHDGAAAPPGPPRFVAALREIWADAPARRFTAFVFVSMIAYSAQDLILEPFAGVAFGFTPGESTQLAGVQHGGALAGMLVAALAGRRLGGTATGSLRAWTIGGCIASALALLGLVAAGAGTLPGWPLRANVFVLGVANGAFSIAAIGSMMALAVDPRDGHEGREGTRMGLWGAAQSIGFAAGGFLGAAASDIARLWLPGPGTAYAAVFAVEALLFVAAARMAASIGAPTAALSPSTRPPLLAAQPERGA
jgi:BCD family chlorophyll transporter-like MFS transporter